MGQPDPHDAARLGEAESLDKARGVEVAVPGRDPVPPEGFADRPWRMAGYGQGGGGRSVRKSPAVRNAVEPQPVDRLEAVDQAAVQLHLVTPDRRHRRADSFAERGRRRYPAVTHSCACEIADGRDHPGLALVILGAGLESIVRGRELERRKRIEDVGPTIEDAGVRTEELVGRAGKEVRPQRSNVDRQVRGGMNRVDVGPGAR